MHAEIKERQSSKTCGRKWTKRRPSVAVKSSLDLVNVGN